MTDLLPGVTGVLVLADGTVLQGIGVGAAGDAVGEVCFNTAMTGYQEILTDPSYMAQIVAFTFPHMGNTGTNSEDLEQMSGGSETAARGAIFRDTPTDPANWRSNATLNDWMSRRGVIGLAGVDTRSLTRLIREKGFGTSVAAGSLCASSCPLVFAGGTERVAAPTSAIAVHQIYAAAPADSTLASRLAAAGSAMSDAQTMTAEISRYLIEMGIDPEVWLRALETPPDRLSYFSPEDLTRLKLATRLSS